MQTDFYNHKHKNNWVNTWVIPVCNILRRSNRGIFSCQRIISKSFELCPIILRMM